ncbi:MAG: saccharopine dehydrogenase NADP-binding domain-containing protein [Candidatus Bathyarchaeota archaeon]|nr:MAG: saccharopine dehydrogenase NADP-binding domain-containing protein [Candidatus Bathyarchaeota archaeon]
MKVIVLGGGGAMGMVTVRDLAESPAVSEVVIGEADLKQAEKVAKWTKSEKVSVCKVDITDIGSLINILPDNDVIANAAPYHLNLNVTEAAIAAQRPLTDLGGVYYMTLRQLELNKQAYDAGVTIVLGCGVAPGIADVLAKYGANMLDSVNEVHIHYGEKNLDPVKYKWSFRTVLEEYTKGPVIYLNGEFKQLQPFSGKHVFKFPAPIGERSCCYALYSGIASLPKSIGKGVRVIDCAMSCSDEDEQRIHVLNEMGLTRIEPIKVKGLEISPRDFLLSCAPPPDVYVKDAAGVVVEVIGEKDGNKTKQTYNLTYEFHENYGVSALAYLTGMPLSIVAQMLGKSEISEKGILPSEKGIRFDSFFDELAKRGVRILETSQMSHSIS